MHITGSIQKTKRSKYWQAVLNIPDPTIKKTKPKWITTKCTNKDEAKKVLRKLIVDYENKAWGIREEILKDIEFISLLTQWENAYENLAPTTMEVYHHNVQKQIIPYFKGRAGGLMLKEIKRKHIQEFVNHLGHKGLKKTSVKKYVSNINKVLEYAVLEELIEHNPCNHIKYPMSYFSGDQYEARYLDEKELIKLLESLLGSDELNDLQNGYVWGLTVGIVMTIFYALRRGEIYGLKWSDIDFENDLIRIENTKVRICKIYNKRPKNKASRSAMPLTASIKSLLKKLQEHQIVCEKLFGKYYEHNNYVIKRDDGKCLGMEYLNKKLQRALEENNLPIVTLHELRHSTATLLRSCGYSVLDIQSWLRHANIESTMIYAHDNFNIKKLQLSCAAS